MKLKKQTKQISTIKQNRQLSLPKLQSRLLAQANAYQFQRLSFPIRDDSSLIGGVGRKHFYSHSSSLQKLINPQYKETKDNLDTNFYSIQQRPMNLYQNMLQNKLHTGNGSIKTMPSQPPFAIDSYRSKNIKKQSSHQKVNSKIQNLRLKSQSTPLYVQKDYFTEKLNLQPRAQPPKIKFIEKQQVITEPAPFMNKNKLRAYNPTYISSDF